MPILPIIDLLIVLGWTSLAIGGVLKAIHVTTHYNPAFLGLGPMDLALVAVMMLLLALTLAARTWVKFNEPELGRRASMAHRERQDFGAQFQPNGGGFEAEAKARD